MATSGIEGTGGTTEGRVRNAILIAGPTASGKSAAALDLAERTGGVIVNTDSMQGYSVLRVLTARPGDEDLGRAPHELYGHVHPGTPYSTGAWLRDVMRLIDSEAFKDGPAIFTGGTGLYFRALAGGLSEMPEIPAPIRDRWRYRLMEEGADRLHGVLQREDPAVAAMLRRNDGQRIARALEVLDASGRSILEWQAIKGRPLIDHRTALRIVIEPERALVVARIGQRLDRMIENGAMEEVAELAALRLDPELPAMRAIGVRELMSAQAGEITVPEAVARAKIATRQYAKRQSTWFRNQFGQEWRRVSTASALHALCELDKIAAETPRLNAP